MRTLILDDDRIFLTVAEGLLYTLGLRGIQATDKPDVARELVSNGLIDLVLLDLNMPNEDGLAFLRTLSEMQFAGAVVLASGEKALIRDSARTLAQKLGLKICGALGKPLDFEELKACVDASRKVMDTDASAAQAPQDVKGSDIGNPELVYQVQHDALLDITCGYEALVRARDLDGRPVSAAAILSNFTDAHERFMLTRQLFGLFCRDIRMFRSVGRDYRFSFNVDAAMFENPDFVPMLTFTLVRMKMKPDDIVLELTETHLPDDESVLLEQIARLSMAGFEFSLDDFSSGASSFEILRAGAFSEVKLDRDLVQRSAEDVASRKYIENMVDIAATLDLRLIAEGVETEADSQRLKAMGIRYMQGYHFGRPTAVGDLLPNPLSQRPVTHVA